MATQNMFKVVSEAEIQGSGWVLNSKKYFQQVSFFQPVIKFGVWKIEYTYYNVSNQFTILS